MPSSGSGSRVKKQLGYQEHCIQERTDYLKILQTHVKEQGSSRLVYIDETKLDLSSTCFDGWAKRGQRVLGEQPGKQNHIKDFIAPMVYSGCLNVMVFVGCLSHYCLPELDQP